MGKDRRRSISLYRIAGRYVVLILSGVLAGHHGTYFLSELLKLRVDYVRHSHAVPVVLKINRLPRTQNCYSYGVVLVAKHGVPVKIRLGRKRI